MIIRFVGTKNKQGRPKKDIPVNTILHNKRCNLGADKLSDQLTGLFLLWSRKQISQDQFIAGCYYENLCMKLNNSMGSITGPRNSSISKVHSAHISDFTNKMQSFALNESALANINAINKIIHYVHVNALNVVNKILQTNAMESAQVIKNLKYNELAMFKQTLSVISQYLASNAINVEKLYKVV